MFMRILLFLVIFAGYHNISLAEYKNFKYFQIDVADGWIAEESDETIKIKPEDGTSGNLVVGLNYLRSGKNLMQAMDEQSREMHGNPVESIGRNSYRFTVKSNETGSFGTIVVGTLEDDLVYRWCVLNNVNLKNVDQDMLAMLASVSMHTIPGSSAERRELSSNNSARYFSESACSRVANSRAYYACIGKCAWIDSNSDSGDAYRACQGNCNGIIGPTSSGVVRACKGDCSQLSNMNSGVGRACQSCGGGPAWAAMYLLGAVMECR
jgi:hypothetical protein